MAGLRVRILILPVELHIELYLVLTILSSALDLYFLSGDVIILPTLTAQRVKRFSDVFILLALLLLWYFLLYCLLFRSSDAYESSSLREALRYIPLVYRANAVPLGVLLRAAVVWHFYSNATLRATQILRLDMSKSLRCNLENAALRQSPRLRTGAWCVMRISKIRIELRSERRSALDENSIDLYVPIPLYELFLIRKVFI